MSDARHGAFQSKDDILALDEPHTVLHNIPFIGTVGLALAANCIAHPAADTLNRRLEALLGAILDLRKTGHSEGIGYDGYILDFAADWLGTLSRTRRTALLDHPRFGDVLDESIALGAPGNIANIAQLSDAEPREMPFHVSCHAKLYQYRPSPRTGWYLKRCPLRWLRADALGALHEVAEDLKCEPPEAGAIDAHYAVVLRSGWESDDLAVAIAASNSKMSHIHNDNGPIVVGAGGRWPISDPGYQQYMKKREREFTLGLTAHNAPVINGMAQTVKPEIRRVALRRRDETTYMAELDLTGMLSRRTGVETGRSNALAFAKEPGCPRRPRSRRRCRNHHLSLARAPRRGLVGTGRHGPDLRARPNAMDWLAPGTDHRRERRPASRFQRPPYTQRECRFISAVRLVDIRERRCAARRDCTRTGVRDTRRRSQFSDSMNLHIGRTSMAAVSDRRAGTSE